MSTQTLFCGVDVGASTTKLVLLDAQAAVVSRVAQPSGVDYAATAIACRDLALGPRPPTDIARTVSTGYGRKNVAFSDDTATEIQCHGVGCHHAFPGKIAVVDIGAQDNKVIHLDENGRRVDFKMNRKCAAGTGSFLEEIALRLTLDVSQFDALAQSTSEAVTLSSFCTVFAKTEILAHLRRGASVAAIVRGAYHAVVARIVEMDPLDGDVVLTGGVAAHHPTVAQVLSQRLGKPVRVPDHAQFTGALGAALTALQTS
jgi:predicted CoA-substrate-specific enzyme activase